MPAGDFVDRTTVTESECFSAESYRAGSDISDCPPITDYSSHAGRQAHG